MAKKRLRYSESRDVNRILYEVGDDDSTGTLTLEAAVREHLNETVTYQTIGTITLGTTDLKFGHFDCRGVLPKGRWIRFRITGTSRIALRELGWEFNEGGRIRR